MSPNRSSRATVGLPRRAQAKWTSPTGFAALPPSGPAIPVTLTAISAREFLSAPSAIAAAVSALTAPKRASVSARNAEQFLLGRVGIDDEAALEHVRRAWDLRQKGGDKPAGARFRRCGHETGRPVAGDKLSGAGDEIGGKHGAAGRLCDFDAVAKPLPRSGNSIER